MRQIISMRRNLILSFASEVMVALKSVRRLLALPPTQLYTLGPKAILFMHSEMVFIYLFPFRAQENRF